MDPSVKTPTFLLDIDKVNPDSTEGAVCGFYLTRFGKMTSEKLSKPFVMICVVELDMCPNRTMYNGFARSCYKCNHLTKGKILITLADKKDDVVFENCVARSYCEYR